MPRPDPLPRFNPKRPSKIYDALDSDAETIRLLKAQLRQAERMVKSIAAECAALQNQLREAGIVPRNPKRRPPEAGIAAPAIPPNGPLPKQGGAEAPLDFSD